MGNVAYSFDTLEVADKLEKAGFDREQAKVISHVIRESHEIADVATKRDLEDVRKDLNAKIEKLSLQLTIRLGVMMVVAVGALATIMKL